MMGARGREGTRKTSNFKMLQKKKNPKKEKGVKKSLS